MSNSKLIELDRNKQYILTIDRPITEKEREDIIAAWNGFDHNHEPILIISGLEIEVATPKKWWQWWRK